MSPLAVLKHNPLNEPIEEVDEGRPSLRSRIDPVHTVIAPRLFTHSHLRKIKSPDANRTKFEGTKLGLFSPQRTKTPQNYTNKVEACVMV